MTTKTLHGNNAVSDFMNGANAVSFDNIGVLSNSEYLANATTQRHERHKQYDTELLRVARHDLVGVGDLLSRGLTTPLEHIGVTISMWERLSEMTAAETSISGLPKGKDDAMTFDEVGVPVPVVFKDWTVNMRQKAALNARNGNFTDVTMVSEATRMVSEKYEDMLFNGDSSIVLSGLTIQGYTNYTYRNTHTLAGSGWAVASGRDPVGDVITMVQKLLDDKQTGRFMLYIPYAYVAHLTQDYSTAKGEKTYMERIKAIEWIEDVKPVASLTGNNVILVKLDRSVVDMAIGQNITNLLWQDSPLQEHYRVMGIMVNRLKSDSNGNCGICHGSV